MANAANAQMLARLHIRAFDLSTDKTDVKVGEPFHITLDVHVDERIASLDNVQLPSLAGFEDLGDERRCTIAAIGTDCVETVTIDALVPGDHQIGPAAIEYVEGTTGHPRTHESNIVTVHVTGTAKIAAELPETPQDNPLADQFWSFVRGVLIFVFVCIAVWALLWGYGRRPRPAVAVAPPPAPEPVPAAPVQRPWAERMRELGLSLQADPTRRRAVEVRAEIRTHIGAGERETIADLTRRDASGGDAHLMTALAAVERAAFCQDDHVADAAREAVPYLMQ